MDIKEFTKLISEGIAIDQSCTNKELLELFKALQFRVNYVNTELHRRFQFLDEETHRLRSQLRKNSLSL